MGFRGAVTGENLLVALEAIRDEIAADLGQCESMRDKAQLYLRLTDVLARIDAIRPAETKGDVVDEITARRSARRASAAPRKTRAKRSG
jgi:hypothetical protein